VLDETSCGRPRVVKSCCSLLLGEGLELPWTFVRTPRNNNVPLPVFQPSQRAVEKRRKSVDLMEKKVRLNLDYPLCHRIRRATVKCGRLKGQGNVQEI
jgi:hypothetical protein